MGLGKKCYWAVRFTFMAGYVLCLGPAFARPCLGDEPPLAVAQATVASHTAASYDAKLTLRVYNYARIDSESLARSEKVADAIFGNVGIETVWVDCPTSKANWQAYPACQSHMGTTDLVLKILPRHMAMKLRRHTESLGLGQACPETEPACELSVFYHRIDELATKGYKEDRILGYVIAHEVAHVLIGPGHSEEGIMRGEWTPPDLQRISWGLPLNFTGDQSKRLRDTVLRRTKRPVRESPMRAVLTAR
jgi:hypothetical protein